ncbi:MAG: hypothetical protein JSS98_08365 [Bacteroidetes bacterium]|nr:hypothetical protein [Bacteroidota bacterium]
MTLKQKVCQYYLQFLNDKMSMLSQVLADLKEAGANETKRSAGDKHETALAMLQIEQANKREQLAQLVTQKNILEKINPELVSSIVTMGSLIKTNRGYLYMSVALGKAEVDGLLFRALSPHSPLGQQLMGLKVGDTAIINNTIYIIMALE